MQTSYVINSEEVIIEVSNNWDEFAIDNDGESVLSDKVVGKSLWEFINGDTTRIWLETLIKYVKHFGETISRPYRCDSPDLKRFMQLEVKKLESGIIELTHTVISTEKRPAPIYFNPSTAGSSKVTKRCSMCSRIYNGKDWIEADLFHLANNREITVIYTICEDCKRLLPNSGHN